MTAVAEVVIRPQRTDDAEGVALVIGAAFANEPDVSGLERDLAQRADSTGLVAVRGERVVGHVRLTRGWIDAPERLVEVLVLSPLSVAPDEQGAGIGRALVKQALRTADSAGAPAVFLEGDPGYYSLIGWRPASSIGVTPPSVRIPEAACQVAVLSAYEPWMRGALVYADTFWSHDSVGLREPGAVVT